MLGIGKKKKKLNFHAFTIERLSKEYGAKRISKEAVEEIDFALSLYLKNIIEKANSFARHAGRKTIMREDIKLALKEKP